MIEWIISVLPVLGPIIAGGASVAAGIRFVEEGERALLTRFDKAVVDKRGNLKVIQPGLRLLIPFVHRLQKIHVRQRTINLPTQTFLLADRTIFNISAVILCRVKDTPGDLYAALFETVEIEKALTDYGLLVIRRTLATKQHQALAQQSKDDIGAELLSQLQLQADAWGMKIEMFELSDCQPTAETAQLIQVGALADLRYAALGAIAEKMGVQPTDIPSVLAAIYVGTPLVATIGSTSVEGPKEQDDRAELRKLLAD